MNNAMRKKSAMWVTFGLIASMFLGAQAAFASTSLSFNFNDAGDLTNNFNSYVQSGTVVQSATGGINNTGAINVPSNSANAVFTTKSSYSLGPVGSSYTFSSFMKSVGNSGYSGFGFTTQPPSAGSASGTPYRPTDAIGISVHGGGFVFHNGATNYFGSWNANNSGIQTVTRASISDLLNSGSPNQWYKIIFKITKVSSTTFDTRVEVWPSDSSGTLLRQSADAIFELNGITNSTITSAPAIYSYINFSGYRVTYFDGFNVELAGGSSVVAPGAPVVLTNSASAANGVVDVNGNVTSDGGSNVVTRGVVYSAAQTEPTVSDGTVIAGSGTGTFTASTSALPDGTYFFRTFATNGVATSYGVTTQVTISGSPVATPTPSATPSASPSASPTPSNVAVTSQEVAAQQLANTGNNPNQEFFLFLTASTLLVSGVLLRIKLLKK